ncbi:TBC1 domain family member 4 [Operophtera brumata]|uniref:TBC1 domain family member 4 n=1 Tax=Operophtera brumata TaxID=104452 RepID=A0A0L7K2Z6_OPEBR|nr:TBC1 domain family member 4 [Operophtera brumata]
MLVLYIGKVRISQRKVPETLIDDALQKFAQHEAEKAVRRRHSLVSSTGHEAEKAVRRHSLLSSTGVCVPSSDINQSEDLSNDSKENLADDKNNEVFNTKNATETPSTTPLEPDKAAWKSAETLTPKTKTKELEDEFDMFTKERVEKKTTAIKRPTSIPLEPSILVLNVPKGPKNLGTVSEDEEKDVRAVISETANSINKFCEDKKNEDRTKNGSKAVSFKEPFSETNTFSPVKDSKEMISNKLVNESSEFKINKDTIVNKTLEENKKEISFEEIRLKANGDNIRKMPENKPFLRDRSASIGTITLIPGG